MANSVKKFNTKNGMGSISRIHFFLWVLTNYCRFLLLTKSRKRLKIDWIEKEQKERKPVLFLTVPLRIREKFLILRNLNVSML